MPPRRDYTPAKLKAFKSTGQTSGLPWKIQLGKRDGVGIDPYDGSCCGGLGVPDFVFELHPEAVVTCTAGERIPKYWDAGYQAEYGRFIQAFGMAFNGDPRLAFLEIGVGLFGETQPAANRFDDCLRDAGLTGERWVAYVKWVIDQYAAAFPTTPLLLEYAPRFGGVCERRELTDYAAEHGVGLQHSGLQVDADSLVMDDPVQSNYGCGQYDPLRKWQGHVVMGWEGTEFGAVRGASATLWRLYNGLDKHPDFILLDYAQVTDPARWDIIRFTNAYAGRTLADTPGVWTALRETEQTWYPQVGNYQFWLYQNDAAPGGRTVPLWHVGPAPEGRYTRRTDQATGNGAMYFNVDDGYVFDGSNTVLVTITYLDQGTDRWALQYDSTAEAEKPAGTVSKTDTGVWQTASFLLEDARFANRQPGGGQYAGSDFRISSLDDGDEMVHFVQVVLQSHVPPTPAETPTANSVESLAPGAPTPTATPAPFQQPPSSTPDPRLTPTPVATQGREDVAATRVP